MITVSQEQLNTVEYLIEQSAQGNHVLFDPETVRHVLTTPIKISENDGYEVEHHIEKLIAIDGLHKQKAYLERLPEETLHRVIKTYFNIVENSLFEAKAERH